MISIAVLGYGTVGSGVVEVIEKNKDVIDKRAGEEIRVKYILDLRDFPGDPYADRVVHDVNIILQDPEKTLTDKDVDKVMERLLSVFTAEFGASLR